MRAVARSGGSGCWPRRSRVLVLVIGAPRCCRPRVPVIPASLFLFCRGLPSPLLLSDPGPGRPVVVPSS
jgi:hypothetical protein